MESTGCRHFCPSFETSKELTSCLYAQIAYSIHARAGPCHVDALDLSCSMQSIHHSRRSTIRPILQSQHRHPADHDRFYP
jgi:hypothetical protein